MLRSAEPTRRAAYSQDLRWRVVWQRLALDLRYLLIARNLNISVGTAHNIFKLFEATGDVEPKKPIPREHKLDGHHELYIIGLILHFPTLQLSELVDKVAEISGTLVSVSTMCRLLAKYGFTRKKVQQIALQRRLDLRASYMASIFTYCKEMFVFLDETGTKLKDMLRQYGYAIRGERAISNRLQIQGRNMTSIAAISTEGLVTVETTNNTVDGEAFLDFLRGTLIPELHPFDGYTPMSIIVMDNCSIHRVQEVQELLNSAGVLTFCLPPYSPDLNPIELTFSYIKHYLKQHEDIIYTISPHTLIKAAFDSITQDMCKNWIEHCGY